MDQLTLCLQHAQSSNPVERKAAEEQLAGLKAAGAATFLVQLAAHIANEAKPADTRRLAGLLLKNAVSAEEEGRRAERAAFWRACDPAAQASVRAALLTTLCSPVRRRARFRAPAAAGGRVSFSPVLTFRVPPGEGGAPHRRAGCGQARRARPGGQPVAGPHPGAAVECGVPHGRGEASLPGGARLRVRGAGPHRAGAGGGEHGADRGGGRDAARGGGGHARRRHRRARQRARLRAQELRDGGGAQLPDAGAVRGRHGAGG